MNNLTGTTLASSTSAVVFGEGTFVFPVGQLPAGGSDVLVNSATDGVQTVTWQLAAGSGATSHVATIFVTTDGTAAPGGTGCTVIGQTVSTG